MAAFTISSYADLQDRISRRAGGSSDSNFTDAIQEAIYAAESQLNTVLRVPEMMVRSRETVNERWESLPPGFLELRASWFINDFDEADPEAGTDIPLRPASPERIAWYSQFSGNPKAICVVGGQYRIEPRATPDTEYHVRLWYYKTVPPISEDAPVTALLERYPLLYLYGALANLGDWLHGDERKADWQALFEREIAAANNAAGRTARMRSYAA